MQQKPHDTGKEEMTNVIYDKLMNNTEHPTIDMQAVGLCECDAKNGYLYFDVDTEKGTKRVHVKIEVEDKDDEE